MKEGAFSRYYEKNKEVLKAKMRRRDAERRQKIKEQLADNPEMVESEREKMRVKYHTGVDRKIKKTLDEWRRSDNINEHFKNFIDNCLLKDDGYKGMTLRNILCLKPLAFKINGKQETSREEVVSDAVLLRLRYDPEEEDEKTEDEGSESSEV